MSLIAAAMMKAPTLLALGGRRAVKDLGDPLLQAWELAWGAHALLTRPWWPWESNTFWPMRHSLAFSDSLYGYAPLGVFFGSGPRAALARYAAMFLLSYALAATGAYLLARQLGCSPLPAAVAAAGYAFAPWHLSQDSHMNVLANGAVPLALALLARGHGVGARAGARARDRPLRPGCALAGWAVAAWQLTLSFTVGLQLAYLLGALAAGAAAFVLLRRWSLPTERRRALLRADLAGMALFGAVGLAFAAPYFQVSHLYPESVRPLVQVRFFSPPPSGFLAAPPQSTLWGGLYRNARAGFQAEGEQALDVGVSLIVLAGFGLVRGSWSRARRAGLAAAIVLLFAVACGTTLFGGRAFLFLYDHLPGWRGVRTPGRIVVLITLALALLAAQGAAALVGDTRKRRLLGLALVGIVLLDGHGRLTAPDAPALSPGLAAAAAASARADPVLVLPSSFALDEVTMWETTAGFPRLVNGGSGFDPDLLLEVRRRTETFPDQASVDYLRRLGVRTVVLRTPQATGTPWAQAASRPIEGLGLLVRDLPGEKVYDLP